MEFAKFIEWAFYGIVSGSVIYGVTLLSDLNKKIAIIIERVAWQSKVLDRHEEELQQLRDK